MKNAVIYLSIWMFTTLCVTLLYAMVMLAINGGSASMLSLNDFAVVFVMLGIPCALWCSIYLWNKFSKNED